MYRCQGCKATFLEPDKKSETHWEVGTRRFKPFDVCPECGCEEFEGVQLCRACNERYITSGEDFCETCIQDTTWCIDQIQRLTGCDWETAKELAEYVINKED